MKKELRLLVSEYLLRWSLDIMPNCELKVALAKSIINHLPNLEK